MGTGELPHDGAQVAPFISPTGDARSTKQESKGRKDEKTFWGWIFGLFSDVKITDVLLAAFTGYLAWVTRGLWKATDKLVLADKARDQKMERSLAAAEKSSQVAEDALEIPNRAYVIAAASPIKVKGDPPIAFVNIEMFNSGKTPAYEFYGHAKTIIAPFPLPADYDFSTDYPADEFPNRQVLTTDRRVNFDVGFDNFANLLEDIKIGSLTCFVYGNLYYIDGFRKDRFVKFCYFMVDNGEGFFTPRIYHAHNDAN